MAFEQLYRRALLGVADAPPIERFLRRRGMSLGVGRFVAGESLDDALSVVNRLEADGLLVILDVLGEFVDDEAAATAMTEQILAAGEGLASGAANGAMSVKPTQIGLGLGLDVALANARRIAELTRPAGVAVCFDMESHEYVDDTLELYRTLHGEGYLNVSTVLQSYLKRSERDLESLLELDPRPELRIVKGAYREPAQVAYQDKARVDDEYRKLLFRLLEAGGRANIGTHDERLLRDAQSYIKGAAIGNDRYEFQMLYGVKPALQRKLRDEGEPVRVYVPFGRDWYGYFSRRLAERPANLAFVLKGMFG